MNNKERGLIEELDHRRELERMFRAWETKPPTRKERIQDAIVGVLGLLAILAIIGGVGTLAAWIFGPWVAEALGMTLLQANIAVGIVAGCFMGKALA